MSVSSIKSLRATVDLCSENAQKWPSLLYYRLGSMRVLPPRITATTDALFSYLLRGINRFRGSALPVLVMFRGSKIPLVA